MKRLTFVIIAGLLSAAMGDEAWLLNREGMRLYEKEEYGKAAKTFDQAGKANPDDRGVTFNEGAAHYKKGDFGKAEEKFTSSLQTDDGVLKKDGLFNLGATKYRQGEVAERMGDLERAAKAYAGAVEAYKKLLPAAPGDNDVRHNLELALERSREVKERKDQQEQKEKDQEKKDKEKTESEQDSSPQKSDQSDQGKPEEKDQNSEQREEEKQPAEETSSASDDKSDDTTPSKPEEGMTPEQALKLLNAIEKDEKNLREEMRSKEVGQTAPVEKDW